METIGYQLRAARARKNCTLEEVEKITKIKVEQLTALEADDFEKMIAPVYTKVFLKSYADFLGLDGHAVSEQFTQQYGETRFQLPLVQPSDTSMAAAGEPFQLTPKILRVALITIALLMVIIAWGWYHNRTAKRSVTPKLAAGPTVTSVNPPRDFYVKAPLLEEVIAAPASSSVSLNHVLTIKARQACYTQLTADGIKIFDGVLHPGQQTKNFTAKRFHLLLGNAGGVIVSFDSKELPKLGRERERVEKDLPVAKVLPDAPTTGNRLAH